MPKPICVKCGRFFRLKRQGRCVMEGMPAKQGALPGIENAADWQPYKVWYADYFECEGCGHQIISGYGFKPVSERHESDFATWLALVEYNVYDC